MERPHGSGVGKPVNGPVKDMLNESIKKRIVKSLISEIAGLDPLHLELVGHGLIEIVHIVPARGHIHIRFGEVRLHLNHLRIALKRGLRLALLAQGTPEKEERVPTVGLRLKGSLQQEYGLIWFSVLNVKPAE